MKTVFGCAFAARKCKTPSNRHKLFGRYMQPAPVKCLWGYLNYYFYVFISNILEIL